MPSERSDTDKAAADLERIVAARRRGPLATLGTYVRLSGPGWLQSAITLGGGSLAASLYLGVLAGSSMLWLQPLAMALGIVMLSAIGYVALTTGEPPFRAICRHVSPVLGWGWALATLAANMVWCLPQYALGTSVVQQNLAPGRFGAGSALGDTGGKVVICAVFLALTIAVTFSYGAGGRGVRVFERVLKALVALIVLSFFGVIVKLALVEGLDWGSIAAGFVPDLGSFHRPAATFAPHLAGLGAAAHDYWTAQIVGMQRDVMIAAAATAVGINMTFLMPYSLLARGWGKEFRGLARFDLATGMLVPFLLATSCIVVVAASRFHAQPVPGLAEPAAEAPAPKLVADYENLLAGRMELEATAPDASELPLAERRLAAMLVKRDAFDLAKALEPLAGDFFASIVFGLGVLAMALSTITMLMLISGFVICEMLGRPPTGRTFRLGTLAATTGVLGPFFWGQAAPYLAIPTSVFGMILLPIAYWTFFLMLNSAALMGAERPRGRSRIAWNALMLPAALVATAASLWSVWATVRRLLG